MTVGRALFAWWVAVGLADGGGSSADMLLSEKNSPLVGTVPTRGPSS